MRLQAMGVLSAPMLRQALRELVPLQAEVLQIALVRGAEVQRWRSGMESAADRARYRGSEFFTSRRPVNRAIAGVEPS
jgi:hypothetical protein